MKTVKGEPNPEGGPLEPPSPRPPCHQGGIRLSYDKAVPTLPWGGTGQGLGKGARAGRREGSRGAGGAWTRGRQRALTSGPKGSELSEGDDRLYESRPPWDQRGASPSFLPGTCRHSLHPFVHSTSIYGAPTTCRALRAQGSDGSEDGGDDGERREGDLDDDREDGNDGQDNGHDDGDDEEEGAMKTIDNDGDEDEEEGDDEDEEERLLRVLITTVMITMAVTMGRRRRRTKTVMTIRRRRTMPLTTRTTAGGWR